MAAASGHRQCAWRKTDFACGTARDLSRTPTDLCLHRPDHRASRQRWADLAAQLHRNRRRPEHGQRSAGRALRASAAAVAGFSRSSAGRRPALSHHRRQFCRADNDHERRAADPVGGGSAGRHADGSVSARSEPDIAGADRRAGAVRPDRGVQPQDHRHRHRGAHHRKPGLFAGAMGDVVDQGRAGFYPRRRRAPPVYGRQPREPTRHLAPLQLANPVFGGSQQRHCRRHRTRRLCRSASGDVGRPDRRPIDCLHLLSRSALCAD